MAKKSDLSYMEPLNLNADIVTEIPEIAMHSKTTHNSNYSRSHNIEATQLEEGMGRKTRISDRNILVQLVYFSWDLLQVFIYVVYAIFVSPFQYLMSFVQLKTLKNQVILVTGAASGIGRELCYELAKIDKSITLICWDMNEKCNEEVVQELKTSYGLKKVYGFTLDISDREAVNKTASIMQSEIGAVTILFQNAGISGDLRPLWEQNPLMIEKVLKVNLLSHFFTLQAFLPHMIQEGGHIVTTCSVLGNVGLKHLSPYVSAKFGVCGYIESLKLDLLAHYPNSNVKFTTVYPNLTNTPMTSDLFWKPKYKFLLTPHDPSVVARKIIQAMKRNQEHLYLPSYWSLLPFIRLITLPSIDRKVHQIFDNPI